MTDLMNMDETFKDEYLAVMLLGSLPEEFEVLKTTLLNRKDVVSLREVCAAMYSHVLRKKDRQGNTYGDTKALVVRNRSQNRSKGKKGRSKSKYRPSKDEYAFCREKRPLEERLPEVKR
ncbi:UNVERIFIED_CONTAM: hypothetical protein Slati_1497100 [Sesamum latifolium]|uniref:Polyprotein n=1 Tax=Sesamum latifolium TaxID=2727402 RepID=A0AAW2X5V8_9LAMI